MKRRSFIGSLFAIPAAVLILPKKTERFTGGKFTGPEIVTPPQIITTRAATGFEIGDRVYWDSKESCLKACGKDFPPKEYQRVFGFVSKKSTHLSNGKSEIDIRGIQ